MTRSLLPLAWQVPQEFRDRLGENVGRQRAMVVDGHLLIVLHKPPKPSETKRAGRFFWRDASGAWKSSDLGDGIQSVQRHLREYGEALQRLDQQQDDAQRASDYFAVLEATSPLLRSSRNMHTALQAAREEMPDVHEVIDIRDRAYEICRTTELLYEDTKNGLEFAIAKRGEDQAESSHQMAIAAHRWNLLAAFFFPVVSLASIFGTNLKHGLEDAYWPLPFLAILTTGLAAGAILKSQVGKT